MKVDMNFGGVIGTYTKKDGKWYNSKGVRVTNQGLINKLNKKAK